MSCGIESDLFSDTVLCLLRLYLAALDTSHRLEHSHGIIYSPPHEAYICRLCTSAYVVPAGPDVSGDFDPAVVVLAAEDSIRATADARFSARLKKKIGQILKESAQQSLTADTMRESSASEADGIDRVAACLSVFCETLPFHLSEDIYRHHINSTTHIAALENVREPIPHASPVTGSEGVDAGQPEGAANPFNAISKIFASIVHSSTFTLDYAELKHLRDQLHAISYSPSVLPVSPLNTAGFCPIEFNGRKLLFSSFSLPLARGFLGCGLDVESGALRTLFDLTAKLLLLPDPSNMILLTPYHRYILVSLQLPNYDTVLPLAEAPSALKRMIPARTVVSDEMHIMTVAAQRRLLHEQRLMKAQTSQRQPRTPVKQGDDVVAAAEDLCSISYRSAIIRVPRQASRGGGVIETKVTLFPSEGECCIAEFNKRIAKETEKRMSNLKAFI